MPGKTTAASGRRTVAQIEAEDAAKRAARWLLARRIGAWLGIILFLAGLLIGSIATGGESKLLGWFIKLFPFALASFILLGIALLLVFCAQWVRNRRWYDENGAGTQMGTVRARVGTNDEKPGDNIAAGIQYGTTTILLGIVILTYFLAIHG